MYHHDAYLIRDYEINKEKDNAKLFLGCDLAAFLTLKKGGSFVAAQFTCHQTLSWNLIIIYASLFDEFYMSKPVTSRPRNGEVYLVGKGFKGLPDKLRDILQTRLEEKEFRWDPLLPKECFEENGILYSALKTIVQFVETINRQRFDYLNSLMVNFENGIDIYQELTNIRREAISRWLQHYPVKTLAIADKIKGREEMIGSSFK